MSIHCFQINFIKCAKEFQPIQNYLANTIIIAIAALYSYFEVKTMSPGMNNASRCSRLF